jgi:hypothetical protein
MEDLEAPFVQVPAVSDMDDETFIKHLEKRHGESLALKFTEEPDRAAKGLPRRLQSRKEWESYHTYLHQLYDNRENSPYRHTHKEAE